MKWQTIDTAPKDTGILLSDGTDFVGVGAWFEGDWVFWEGNKDAIFDPDEFHREPMAKLDYWVCGYVPSHWMPLPPPPGTPEPSPIIDDEYPEGVG